MRFKQSIRKFKGFVNRHKIPISIILVALLAAVAFIAYDSKKIPGFQDKGLDLKPKKETRVAAPLTGILVDKAVTEKRPFAVVVENSPDARPQSGYNKADIVYETLAEGGITRTLAIFQSQEVNEVGPVRSARPYFIDWMSEYNAIFAHVGGSIDATDYISSTGISDLNQFNFGSFFWRSTDRVAPHNVYTTSQKLLEAAKSARYETSIKGLQWHTFKTDAEEKDRPESQKITIPFSGPLYTASYTYNRASNDYSRYVAGAPAKDKVTGEQIKTKNIIVQFETVGYGITRAGEQKVNIGTIGKGNGLLFQDGKAIKITWEKTSRTALTEIKDEGGNEFKLNPGQTWIEVPPVGANVTY